MGAKFMQEMKGILESPLDDAGVTIARMAVSGWKLTRCRIWFFTAISVLSNWEC